MVCVCALFDLNQTCAELLPVIVKWGDDLRQELVCAQLLEQFQVRCASFLIVPTCNISKSVTHSRLMYVRLLYMYRLCGNKNNFHSLSDRELIIIYIQCIINCLHYYTYIVILYTSVVSTLTIKAQSKHSLPLPQVQAAGGRQRGWLNRAHHECSLTPPDQETEPGHLISRLFHKRIRKKGFETIPLLSAQLCGELCSVLPLLLLH